MDTRSRLDDDPSFLLARANAVSVQAGNAALAAHGLRVRSYAVLALSAAADAPTQRELADHLRLDPSQVVALVDDLEARGLVTREPDPSDRRTRVVRITRAGRPALEAAERDLRAAESPLHDRLTPSQRAALPGILRALAFPVEP
ncbi:MAG: winged helix-turn-helix transcriptional regulator [Microbacteriaceae bacterium]|nr:winged helix-turn-helix transcriptional regulator [Microbacteriaceae bacterium]